MFYLEQLLGKGKEGERGGGGDRVRKGTRQDERELCACIPGVLKG